MLLNLKISVSQTLNTSATGSGLGTFEAPRRDVLRDAFVLFLDFFELNDDLLERAIFFLFGFFFELTVFSKEMIPRHLEC